jgi:hypothetical protein
VRRQPGPLRRTVPLTDATARERALDLAQARGPRQEAFAERLLADPPGMRARVRDALEQCAEAFAVLRRAGLLTARRHGRYIRYTLNLPDPTALGTDVLAAVLR